MGALKIECRMSEPQLMRITEEIEKHIADFEEIGVNDYEGVFSGGIQVFVDFEPMPRNGVAFKKDTAEKRSVEVLTTDYDLLEEDTAVLKYYLKRLLADYNRQAEQQYVLHDGYSWAEEMGKELYYQNRYGL